MECPHYDLWVDTVGVCSNRNQTPHTFPFRFMTLSSCVPAHSWSVCDVFDHVGSFKSDFWNSLRA